MQKNILLRDLAKDEDLQILNNILREIYDEMDDLYLTSSPNGVVSARRGRGALVLTGGNYYRYVNVDGGTTWRGVQLTLT